MTQQLFRPRSSRHGFFVTVDGPNGSGKTSLVSEVAALLSNRRPLATRQPSPTWLGEAVREAESTVRGRALACLVAGDRHHQVDTEILPALDGGRLVICDRYIESSLVLQRIDGVTPDFIVAVNAGIARPDLRIRLVARASVLAKRLSCRTSDPSRRFENAPDTPQRELDYYADADALLTRDYDAPAVVFDSSETRVAELASRVSAVIETRARERV